MSVLWNAIIHSRDLRLWYEFLLEIRGGRSYHLHSYFSSLNPRSGVLRTQNLRSPRLRIQRRQLIFFLKPRAGENIAKLSSLFCFLPFRTIRLHFFLILSLIFNVSSVGRRNKNRSLCSSSQPIDSGSRILYCNSESDVFAIVIRVSLPPLSLPALSIKAKILWIMK